MVDGLVLVATYLEKLAAEWRLAREPTDLPKKRQKREKRGKKADERNKENGENERAGVAKPRKRKEPRQTKLPENHLITENHQMGLKDHVPLLMWAAGPAIRFIAGVRVPLKST